jgi:hypothetical protein
MKKAPGEAGAVVVFAGSIPFPYVRAVNSRNLAQRTGANRRGFPGSPRFFA